MKAGLPNREPRTLEWWSEIDVFRQIRKSRESAEPYGLHDGPPYANGHIHIGHALNKVLKDIVVKSRTMMGFDAHYIPGWDCHGLPIEHHMDKELGSKKAQMSALQFRAACRKYAEKFIVIQGDEFQRLGVLWDRATDRREHDDDAPNRTAIYRTLDRTYEAEIIRQVGRFFSRGSVYQGDKPVHWCPSCRTALAEAEVEYRDRTDPSVYVKFPVDGLEKHVPALAGRNVSLAIWTTTPWTLPANLAVALHPELPYVAVAVGEDTFIVAEGLLSNVRETLGWGDDSEIVARFTGAELLGTGDDYIGAAGRVQRPYPTEQGPGAGPGLVILGDHVTLDAGTGDVHTAPGHGADDFVIGREYDLPPFNPVGDDGHFLADRVGPEWLKGVFVLKANKLILKDLEERGLLLHSEDYLHSYPHCWRCKNAVLFRSTPQWFIAIDHDDLRGRAIEAIRNTKWLPAFGEARIAGMVENRPDWCISRQRAWGVPIPAVTCARCLDEHPRAFIQDQAFFDHLEALVLKEGSDAWYGVPDGDTHRPYESGQERLARLIPEGIACPFCHKRDRLTFHDHIVDVWFESGVSHSAVLGADSRHPWPADLYLEGHDQYRGWFHSSLLVAVNDRETAPYKEVVTHGFTLDGHGKKMSKSMGNAISPDDICKQRGADILRLCVSMVDYLEDMPISQEIMDRNAEAYRKIRNTFRYLLGNLKGFDPATDSVPYEEMEEIDRWAMQQTDLFTQKLVQAYKDHQYHVIYHGLHTFCGVTLSSFYLDILKDRLYTFPADCKARRSAQTVLYRLANDLCRLMAPVLVFTAEEIWQALEPFHGREPWQERTIHTELFPATSCPRQDDALLKRWQRLIDLRSEISPALENARQEKLIGTSLAAKVVLDGPDEEIEFLKSFGDDLKFYLLTSGVEFGDPGEGVLDSKTVPGFRVGVLAADGEKCQRCWNYTTDVDTEPSFPGCCKRCVGHIHTIMADKDPA